MNKMRLRRKRNNPARRRIERTSLDTKNRLSRRSLEQTKEGSSTVSEELVENAKQTEEEIEKIFSGVQDLEPLRKIVEGKRVIYVGPSPILKGRGLGEFIDSFDVVVRCNNMYKVPEELWEDYGKRCDVAYFIHAYLRYNKLDLNTLLKNKTVIFAKSGKVAGINGVPWFQYKTRVFFEDKTNKITNRKIEGRTISTGLLTMKQILRAQASLLYVTGIDFYTTQDLHVVHYKNKRPVLDSYQKYHADEPNVLFFSNHIAQNENVQYDDYLIEILKHKGISNV